MLTSLLQNQDKMLKGVGQINLDTSSRMAKMENLLECSMVHGTEIITLAILQVWKLAR